MSELMRELGPLFPEILMTVLTLSVFLAGLAVKKKSIMAFLSILGAAAAAYAIPISAGTAFNGMFISDGYGMFFKYIFMLNISLTALMSIDYSAVDERHSGEYYSLVLLASIGMMLMASAGDLIVLYLGLELMSLSTYVLTGFLRHNLKSNEASLKYFLLGTFATAILLYGIAMIYGLTGATNLKAVADYIAKNGLAANPVMLLAVISVTAAFSFKIAAAPFHMWAPDAYEGAPTPITAFMSIGPKTAAFAAFGRVLFDALGSARMDWGTILIAIAIATIVVGNMFALAQTNIKRMLAYSSIAHAGYMLMGIIPGTKEGMDAMMTYMLIYAFMNMGAFAVVIALGKEEIKSYDGIARRHPLISAAMLVFMFSLAGIPPTAGFIGKLSLFMAVIKAGYAWLAVIAVIFSAVSAYYYLRVVVNMYMKETEEEAVIASSPSLGIAILIIVLMVFIIGIMPSPFLNL
ncbi:MAG: NADH-quinone oxidoreductase subunit N [Nitrospirae bacterium]|nr:NADH-quinone oxidoreductase subunit N [Nitrospirota bacterium]